MVREFKNKIYKKVMADVGIMEKNNHIIHGV